MHKLVIKLSEQKTHGETIKVEMFIYKIYYDLDTTVLLKGIHKIKILKPIDVISNVNDSWKGSFVWILGGFP